MFSCFQDAGNTPRLTASRHVLTSQEAVKSFQTGMKRTVSNSNSVYEADYGSDLEVIDIAEGYMSDGGVLRSNIHSEDFLSG